MLNTTNRTVTLKWFVNMGAFPEGGCLSCTLDRWQYGADQMDYKVRETNRTVTLKKLIGQSR